MARKVQANSFEKGMVKSLSKDRIANTSYRNARNFRLGDDKENSKGAIVNVLGNELDFTLTGSPDVYKVEPIENSEAPLPGAVDFFSVETAAGTVSTQIQLLSGGFESYFSQIVDAVNNPTSGFYALGIKAIKTSTRSIVVFSEVISIDTVNGSGGSTYTITTKVAHRCSNLEIIGKTVLRNSLILFTCDSIVENVGDRKSVV